MFYKRIRAWNKETKKMYKVEALDFVKEIAKLGQFIKDTNIVIKTVTEVAFKDLVLMHESGLQDDLKFNIFEGDIIEWEGHNFTIYNGDYGDANTGINGHGWHMAGILYTFPYMGGGEKIGNIYEDFKLMEEEKE